MLLEGAIGDAFGAGFEYADSRFIERHINSNQYIKHPRHKLVPGVYTDDTQMSLALAELLIEKKEWTKEIIAQKFVEVFKRDPREGYSQHFYTLLCEVNTGEELLAKIKPNSNKSGAAMRASVIGRQHVALFVVCEMTEIQARITHDNDDAVMAAKAAAIMTYWCCQLKSRTDGLPDYLEKTLPGIPWATPWSGPVGSAGLDSVRAALTAIASHNSLNAILRACIAYTGDVDTVACIALSAASCSSYIKKDLPQTLFDGLENGKFGRDYLIGLDKQFPLL